MHISFHLQYFFIFKYLKKYGEILLRHFGKIHQMKHTKCEKLLKMANKKICYNSVLLY
jgi:hypothetical protein